MEKITIYTDTEGRVFMYQNENNTLTAHEVTELPLIPEEPLKDGYLIYIDGVFTFGYELNENKCHGAINDLKAKLNRTRHIVEKEVEGCDMTQYGDWKAEKDNWRVEINRIEDLLTSTNQ